MYVYIKEEGSSHYKIRMDEDPDCIQPQRDLERGGLTIVTSDAKKRRIAGVSYEIQQADLILRRGYTSGQGKASFYLPMGKYTLVLRKKGLGRTRVWDIPISWHKTTWHSVTMYPELTWDGETDYEYTDPPVGRRD
jgi:hypothetical protein